MDLVSNPFNYLHDYNLNEDFSFRSQQPTQPERKTIYCYIKDKMELELVLTNKKHLDYIRRNRASQNVNIRIRSFALNRITRHFHDKKGNILILRKKVSVKSPC